MIISSTTPVVAQQFGDKAIVEQALVVLLVQREVIHHALQEGHSCRQQRLSTPEIHTQIEQDYVLQFKYCTTMYPRLPNYSYKQDRVHVSELTHAVLQCKGGSENGSELLGVSSQNNMAASIEQPFVTQIPKINQHVKQYNYKTRNAVVLFTCQWD